MTRSAILMALCDVEDPEFGVSVVDMGLIIDAWDQQGEVTVKLTFTAMGCPATDMIIDDIRERLLREPQIRDVKVDVVWDPIWTSDRLTEDGKFALLSMGVAV